MKRIIILVFLFISIIASAQSRFYTDYSHRDEVENAVFLKNHKIDGIRVDITLIRAKDRTAFLKLLSELDLPSSADSNSALGILFCIRNNDNPQLKQPSQNGVVSLKGTCLIGASEAELTIYAFHNLGSEKRFRKIMHYILNTHSRGQKPAIL